MARDARNARTTTRERIINVRKLAALDIALHGAPLILIEFGAAVALGTAGGAWLTSTALPVSQGAALFRLVLGAYLLCIAINYVPLLLYGIAVVRRRSARQEAAAELAEKDGRSARRYGTQSLLLILPLVIPALALAQEMRAPALMRGVGSFRSCRFRRRYVSCTVRNRQRQLHALRHRHG